MDYWQVSCLEILMSREDWKQIFLMRCQTFKLIFSIFFYGFTRIMWFCELRIGFLSFTKCFKSLFQMSRKPGSFSGMSFLDIFFSIRVSFLLIFSDFSVPGQLHFELHTSEVLVVMLEVTHLLMYFMDIPLLVFWPFLPLV